MSDTPSEQDRRAAFTGQCHSLRLRPWQTPPGWLNENVKPEPGPSHISDLAAWKVLRAMLALGISRYHPDPLAAIAEARRKRQ